MENKRTALNLQNNTKKEQFIDQNVDATRLG
jgi:hypothetical protein